VEAIVLTDGLNKKSFPDLIDSPGDQSTCTVCLRRSRTGGDLLIHLQATRLIDRVCRRASAAMIRLSPNDQSDTAHHRNW
jgi:hypothetical protein